MTLGELQQKIKVPKDRDNEYGGFSFRNAEDILDEIKKHLGEDDFILLNDEVEYIEGRYYMKSTALLNLEGEEYTSVAYAREQETHKKMSSEQLTGSASSYARKYALGGLLGLSEGNDPDETLDKDTKTEEKTVSDYRKELENSKNMSDLRYIWAEIPAKPRKKLEKVKDKMKQKHTKRSDGGNDDPMTDKQWEFLEKLTSSDKIDNKAILAEHDVKTLEELDKSQASDVIEEITENDGYRADMDEDIEA